MLKVVLLVCSAHIAPSDCRPDNAIYLMNGPDATHVALCGMQSQAYLAQTWIGRSLTDGEYLKIVCRRGAREPFPAEASAKR